MIKMYKTVLPDHVSHVPTQHVALFGLFLAAFVHFYQVVQLEDPGL